MDNYGSTTKFSTQLHIISRSTTKTHNISNTITRKLRPRVYLPTTNNIPSTTNISGQLQKFWEKIQSFPYNYNVFPPTTKNLISTTKKLQMCGAPPSPLSYPHFSQRIKKKPTLTTPHNTCTKTFFTRKKESESHQKVLENHIVSQCS